MNKEVALFFGRNGGLAVHHLELEGDNWIYLQGGWGPSECRRGRFGVLGSAGGFSEGFSSVAGHPSVRFRTWASVAGVSGL